MSQHTKRNVFLEAQNSWKGVPQASFSNVEVHSQISVTEMFTKIDDQSIHFIINGSLKNVQNPLNCILATLTTHPHLPPFKILMHTSRILKPRTYPGLCFNSGGSRGDEVTALVRAATTPSDTIIDKQSCVNKFVH